MQTPILIFFPPGFSCFLLGYFWEESRRIKDLLYYFGLSSSIFASFDVSVFVRVGRENGRMDGLGASILL